MPTMRAGRQFLLFFTLLTTSLLSSGARGAEFASQVPGGAATPTALGATGPRLFPVLQGGKFGYINSSGKVIIHPQFEDAHPFSGGLAVVKAGSTTSRQRISIGGAVFEEKLGGFGYIDPSGKLAIKPVFDRAFNFSPEGLAVVEVKNKCRFIDRTGAHAFGIEFDDASSFSEGLAQVQQGGKWGWIDSKGNMVIPAKFEVYGAGHASFHDGLAPVKLGDKYGYINKTGAVVIQARYDLALEFSEQMAPVKISDKWGFIDRTGALVIKPFLDESSRFSEGLASAEVDRKTGYIDKSGSMVIQAQFEWAYPFNEGLAAAGSKGKMGFIDKTGAFVIPPKYAFTFDFTHGLAKVKVQNKFGYINKSGSLVWPPTN